ncbi:MAG: M14 family zinc carboxypeptidase [Panacibacter sp.]
MRKFLLAACIIVLCASATLAQQKYYRVQLLTNEKGLQKLAAAGITIDHGDFKKGISFTSDFSEDELNIIKQSGIEHQVLIRDLSTYYAARSNDAATDKSQPATAACTTYAKPKNFKYGSMGGFYTYAEMLATLDSMASKYPKLISVKQVVSSTLTTGEGRPLYYVKISDHPNNDEAEPKILYTALHHAREPESLSQLVFYMWYILENYKKDPFVKSLVDSTEMFFIPCLNPDGYIYNQTTNPNGGGLWRKNRRPNGNGSYGVDLNRNYGYKWGYDNVGSSNIGSSDTYRGASPFSEPETQMVRDFCNSHPFYFALNNHTYSNVLIYPWGYKANTYTPAPDSLIFKNDAIRLAQCNGFITGTPNQTVGYIVNGSSDDWMYAEQTTKAKIFALTPEAGTSSDGFWPRKNRIIPLAQINMDMNLTAARFTKESAVTLQVAMASNNDNIIEAKEFAITGLSNAPNPCNSYTYVSYQAGKPLSGNNLKLSIFNASGMVVKTMQLNALQTKVLVNTAGLNAGIYYYSISDGHHKSDVAKLVVVK